MQLQGNLKDITVINAEKLIAIIERDGFAFPLAVAFINDKPFGIIDGHQRHRVVSLMLQRGYVMMGCNGQSTECLPCVRVDCKDKRQAGRLILAAVSQFGKVNDEGLYKFTHDFGLEVQSMHDFNLPDFNTDTFVESYAPEEKSVRDADDSLAMGDIVENSAAFKKFQDAKRKMRDRSSDIADQGFYVCLVFQSHAQKAAFCKSMHDIHCLYTLYMNGEQLCKKIGVEIPPAPSEITIKSKVNAELSGMVLGGDA